ncbi:venom carboxylesterase-6-like isoform X2 [Tribolium madens]|uniref:venom carboxylesterase-6-like isoform X2 n=1 Tax=Tribolium madens TaxID=41895 RepID=UPI001CF756A9|nr:venom carboxylesterase-6-like isoform X2 [Tribolium madens]
MKLLLLIVLINSNFLVALGTSDPLVDIPPLGVLQGGYKTSLKGRTFYSFEGVPYARPPVGKYRFREPVPPKPWHGIWEAKTIYKCMQYYQYTPPGGDFVIGDEDCLYLNIYTPELDAKANFDVIVYIHGGAFMFNWGGIQGPEYLLGKDVVYVNLNYRLGPLGFLSTENEVVPGNNGLKDQILALEWIKKHIVYFGGNPNSVTLIGMSAGGASVHFHYLSPKSRGLFHRGMSQSGTMLNPWVLMEQPLEKTQKMATHLGCPTDTKSMVECLKRRPGRQIVEAVRYYQPWLYNPFSPFGVVVDSWSQDPVLPDHPYNLIKSKKMIDSPWITSYTSSEGLYPASDFYIQEEYLNEIDKKWNQVLPFILDYNYTLDPKKHEEISQKIRRFYLGEKRVNRENFLDFVKILTDRLFVYDIQKTIFLQNQVTNSPIFLYYFAYRGAHSKSEFCSGSTEDFGASHGDDTAYIYKYDVVKTDTNDQDKKMIKFFVDLITTYAHTGRPKVGIEWPQVPKNLKDKFTFLKIDSPTKLSVGRGTAESTKFWDSLPIKENEKLFPDVKDEL